MESNFPNENISFRDKVFFTMIEEMAKNYIGEKNYINIIKNFIKKFVMINNVLKESKDSIYFKNSTKIYNKIFFYLIEIDSVFKINNDQNFMTDFINYLVKAIFDINGSLSLSFSGYGSGNGSGSYSGSGSGSNSNHNSNNSSFLININYSKDDGVSNNLGKILFYIINYLIYFSLFLILIFKLYYI